jgi:hypothetical protein
MNAPGRRAASGDGEAAAHQERHQDRQHQEEHGVAERHEGTAGALVAPARGRPAFRAG